MNVKSLVLSIDETLYDRIKLLAEERAKSCPTHRDIRKLEAGYRSVRGLSQEEQLYMRRILESSSTPAAPPLYWTPADALRYQEKRLRARQRAVEAARAAVPAGVAARKPSVLSVIRELLEVGLAHAGELPQPASLPEGCTVQLPPANIDPDTGAEYESLALTQRKSVRILSRRNR